MEALFFTLVIGLVILAIRLDRSDSIEARYYHQLQPVEDGCMHDVEPQPHYPGIDEDQYGFGMEHWDMPFTPTELGNAAKASEKARIKAMLQAGDVADECYRCNNTLTPFEQDSRICTSCLFEVSKQADML